MNDPSNQLGDPLVAPPEFSLTSAPGATSTDESISDAPPQVSPWAVVREIVETVVLALILFLVIRQVIQNYRIESHSMEPNFYEGQFVLVNKLAYKIGEPHRGEVIVFHNPGNPDEDYIKRVIGLPGDTVEVVGDAVLINGQELPQPYPHNLNPADSLFGPKIVGDSELFVMGDNRPNSSDSRRIGAIPEDLVVGKAWLRVWPFSEFGLVDHYQLQTEASVE